VVWHQITGFWSAVRIAALLQNCIRLMRGAAALLLPLCTGDQEPVVDLHSILEQVHEEAALKRSIIPNRPFHPSATMILPDSDFAEELSSVSVMSIPT